MLTIEQWTNVWTTLDRFEDCDAETLHKVDTIEDQLIYLHNRAWRIEGRIEHIAQQFSAMVPYKDMETERRIAKAYCRTVTHLNNVKEELYNLYNETVQGNNLPIPK